MRQLILCTLMLALAACGHPMEIIGEGDITSASGDRDCSLEEFINQSDNCAVNLVIEDYNETYTATPRAGWTFDRWYNGCNASLTNQCSFNISADIVRDNWGKTMPALTAKFREQTSGYESLFIGHSFFIPMANTMDFHAANAGLSDHSQETFFSGGGSGAPESLWDNETQRMQIQAMLDTGTIELFGMTYHPGSPTMRGYELWSDYALAQNSDTKIFVAMPWSTNPGDFDPQEYHSSWKDQGIALCHGIVDNLRQRHPTGEFYCLPYGQAAGELYTRFAQGQLLDVTSLVSSNGTGVFNDEFGHADPILVDLASLIWLYSIYGVRPVEYAHDFGYLTDIKEIADTVIRVHDPHYDAE
ncbi:MAG: hypothetical protein AAF850_00730 [Pseudomonadota bacterium]